KALPVLCIKSEGTWVKGVFSEFENNAEFDAFVAENGGFSIEVFYLDNSTTGANRGIVCSTESISGDAKRSGWGIAESASGAPYFITGHTAENEYSSVYAAVASQDEFVHVVGVYNAETKRNAIYVNGKLVSSDSAAGAFTSANKTEAYEGFNMANVFYIGADPSSTAGLENKCDFSANDLMVLDIKFYKGALTEAEVKTVYASGARVFE
ncbi:MAG: LamG domain-containing protein, partial [Clostridia bacterium]|nr:LamG domain-containing protein [Clostridia bacterium]